MYEQHMPWRWKWLRDVAKLTLWWWRSLLHMRHDIESCDQGGEDQDKTWLDGSVASMKGKLEALERWIVWWWSLSKDLAQMDRCNGEGQVRSRSMNQYDHVMIWSGSYHLWYGWCMCCINIRDGIEYARQMYICRAFYFTDHRCVEKFMTGFRIDGRAIKRSKLVGISVII